MGPAAARCRVLLQQIPRDGKKVGLRIEDRIRVPHTQHSQIHLLHEVRGVGLGAQAPMEEGLQGTAVRKNSPDESLPGFSHERLSLTIRLVYPNYEPAIAIS